MGKSSDHNDRLLEDAVAFMTEDGQGHIWIGYSDDIGVSRLVFEGGHLSVEHFTQKNYLTSGVINFLESDHRGWVRVGTDSGVDVWCGPESGGIMTLKMGSLARTQALMHFSPTRTDLFGLPRCRGLAHFDVSKEGISASVPSVALTDVGSKWKAAGDQPYADASSAASNCEAAVFRFVVSRAATRPLPI